MFHGLTDFVSQASYGKCTTTNISSNDGECGVNKGKIYLRGRVFRWHVLVRPVSGKLANIAFGSTLALAGETLLLVAQALIAARLDGKYPDLLPRSI